MFRLLCLFLLLNVTKIFCFENNSNNDSLLKDITIRIYNEDWNGALHLISQIEEREPNSPVPYFYKGSLYFRKLYSTLNQSYKDSAKFYFEKSYAISENIYEQNEKNEVGIFYYGASSGYLGMYYAYEKSFFSAAKYGVKGVNLLKKSLDLDPENYDAYLGLGIYTYIASKAPFYLRWLINILGVETNTKISFDYLNKTISFGNLATYEAKDKLCNFYLAEGNYQGAKKLISELRLQFPKGSWFSFLEVLIFYKAKEWDKVVELGENYVTMPNKSEPYLKKIKAYQIEALFNIGDYNSAINKFKEVNYKGSKDYLSTAIAEYFTAKSFEKIGMDKEAKDHFKTYIKIVDDKELDKDEDYLYAKKRLNDF